LGLLEGGVEPAVVSAQEVFQLSHPLLDLCDQFVALQTLVAFHDIALSVGFSRWGLMLMSSSTN
jgi:dienelactone hydrolase